VRSTAEHYIHHAAVIALTVLSQNTLQSDATAMCPNLPKTLKTVADEFIEISKSINA
jgi:hypothetical protein